MCRGEFINDVLKSRNTLTQFATVFIKPDYVVVDGFRDTFLLPLNRPDNPKSALIRLNQLIQLLYHVFVIVPQCFVLSIRLCLPVRDMCCVSGAEQTLDEFFNHQNVPPSMLPHAGAPAPADNNTWPAVPAVVNA